MDTILKKILVDPRLETTLAMQIREQIGWLIASGQLKTGDGLPSVRMLAQHLSVNVNTVRSAYQKLEALGMVETRQGAGTKVCRYDPLQVAPSGGARRSNTIGVIVPSLSNPLYQSLLDGIEDAAREERPLIFVCNTHDDLDEAQRYFAKLAAKGVDGVIVSSLKISGRLQVEGNAGDGSRLPVVSVDWPDSLGYVVLMDLEGAGYLATRHLLEHGHRRVGLITLAIDIPTIREVNDGYRRALREFGIQVDEQLTAGVYGFDMASGEEGARLLMALEQPPTAVFAATDLLAIGALRTIQAAGLRIPGDIALVGFNDISLTGLVNPALTTVVAPMYAMGQEAMRMLQTLIGGAQPECQRVTLPTTLSVRQSCGCK